MKIKIILIAICYLLSANYSYAVDRMESSSYKIKWPNLNMTSGSKSSANYNILDTLGQTAPGQYASSGYYVKAGFPYIKTIIPFAFSISNLSINFGSLTPNAFPDPLPSHTLTVSSGGAGGYSVAALENHPLQLKGTATNIPDTDCNSGCTQTAAGVWDQTAKYGFGFNMSGNDIPADFINSTYFRHFANAAVNEPAEIVMESNNVGKNRIATVTYKANISTTQAAGNYENSITYIATPGY